jgi:inorganic pyrophosphatase/exopolyphosphatase
VIIVTSYRNPDLDGVSCAIAYAELLKKQGVKKVRATYCGQTGAEVEFLQEYCGLFPIENKCGGYAADDRFVIVDTADPGAIDPEIPIERVVEIFDHRRLVFVKKFVNARSVVEEVGACATLITDQFQVNKLKPSPLAATYLYGAIISNTINFKNAVSTGKDRAAAGWLLSLVDLPKDFVKRMFLFKSNVGEANLAAVIEQDFSTKEINGKTIGIAQVEVADLDKIVEGNKPKLVGLLRELKEKRRLDYLLFTGIDILAGFNRFIVLDEESRRLFRRVLGLKDFPMDVKVEGIVMRKQIWPELDKWLRK